MTLIVRWADDLLVTSSVLTCDTYTVYLRAESDEELAGDRSLTQCYTTCLDLSPGKRVEEDLKEAWAGEPLMPHGAYAAACFSA